MKHAPQKFAIRKDRRDLRPLGRLLGTLFKVGLLVTVMGLYWRWNHGDPGLGPIFLSERKLVTSNAIHLVPALGLAGSAAMIVAGFKVLRARAEVRLQKQATQIRPRKFEI
jgi:hypothetical protein